VNLELCIHVLKVASVIKTSIDHLDSEQFKIKLTNT